MTADPGGCLWVWAAGVGTRAGSATLVQPRSDYMFLDSAQILNMEIPGYPYKFVQLMLPMKLNNVFEIT